MVKSTGESIVGVAKFAGRGFMQVGLRFTWAANWITGQDNTAVNEWITEVDAAQGKVVGQGLEMAKFLGSLLVDTAAILPKLEIGLLTGDMELINSALHGGETHRKVFAMVSEVLTQTATDLTGDMPKGQKGYIIGKIVYEVVSFVIPMTKAGKVMEMTKSKLLGKLIGKTNNLLGQGAQGVAIRKAGVCNGPWGCFMAGEQVMTKNGCKNIENIRKDDLVWTRNPNCPDQSGWKRVTEVQVTHPRELYHLTYELRGPPSSLEINLESTVLPSQETVHVTGEHPFWVERDSFTGFVPVNALRIGDMLSRANGESAVVTRKTTQHAPRGQTFTTYNFTVEDHHTYFVGQAGVWVHNNYPNQQSLENCASVADSVAEQAGHTIDDLGKDRFSNLVKERGADLKAGRQIPDTVWMNHGHRASDRIMQDFMNGVITRVDDMPTVRHYKEGFYMRQTSGSRLAAGDFDLHHIAPRKLTKILKKRNVLPQGFDEDMVPGMIMTKAEHIEMNRTLNTFINDLDNLPLTPEGGVEAVTRLINNYRNTLGQPAQAAVLEAFYKKLGILPDA